MKRQSACILLLLFLLGAALPKASAMDSYAGYADLKRGAWYEQGVRFCIKRGLMCGSRNYGMHFYPDDPVTRSQLAAILWRLDGQPVIGLVTQFQDVPEGAWYEDAVRWALAEDIMGGETPAEFSPEMPITRERLVQALRQYAFHRNGSAPILEDAEYETYSDYDKTSADCDEAMRWAFGLGLIQGVRTKAGVGYLTPWAISTRAGTATILMRFCLDFGVYDS